MDDPKLERNSRRNDKVKRLGKISDSEFEEKYNRGIVKR